ncbi:MAG: hypothetical protein N4A54_00520 [Peptostreptococcaceae bacterium]|nr:hypothetical protein [Peptostreptococcaceae bacterium]
MIKYEFKKYEFTDEQNMRRTGNYYDVAGSVALGPYSEEVVVISPESGFDRLDEFRNVEILMKNPSEKYDIFIRIFDWGKTTLVSGPSVYEGNRQNQLSWFVSENMPIVGQGLLHGEKCLRGVSKAGNGYSRSSTILGVDIPRRIEGVKLVRIDRSGSNLKLIYRNETADRVDGKFILRGYAY